MNFDGFSRASQFQSDNLKMVARSDDSMRDFDSGNSENRVEIRFVDEDDLPLALVMEHRASKGEFYSGESEYSGENSGDEESADDSDEEMDDGEEEWSEEIRRRPDINFDNDTCGINAGNQTSCLDFFELFFTPEVWQLLVTQTKLYAEQKRGPAESAVWYPVTENEMKAWFSLYLNMGLVTKPNITVNWRTEPVLSSPIFTSVMSCTRFLQILRYQHFADNNLAPPHESEEHNKLYKIQPFLNLVIARFQEVYSPDRQLARDFDQVQRKLTLQTIYPNQARKIWYKSLHLS